MGYFAVSQPAVSKRTPRISPVGPKTHTPVLRLQGRGSRYYSPGLGRWISRDPIEEDGGPNVYAFVGNQVLEYVDPHGLQQQNVSCGGICGAIIDEWILAEIQAQFSGWDAWKKNNSNGETKPITIDDYLKWANGNQRYKDPSFFTFNRGVYPRCGTEDPSTSSVGCGRSVTLCGRCIRSSILGNIMYGIVGRYAGFTEQELRGGATNTKKKWGLRVDRYDEAAYGLGSGVFDNFVMALSVQGFCSRFNNLVQNNSDALREGNRSGGFNDLSTCRTCSERSQEGRHGGNESPRINPF
jgi:RHS repeat-associated protein